ncbi:hypothetical protein HaLaN_01434 [Haematococcus lacustris]|uniref:Uncharacterized protein n=1 Tax=Haematococcus lacustris TaxID=44745 RepID=A0A699Y995_HAELA|nr:hypothetical protein HaLaN_01434 [Haematococcus lacustris]
MAAPAAAGGGVRRCRSSQLLSSSHQTGRLPSTGRGRGGAWGNGEERPCGTGSSTVMPWLCCGRAVVIGGAAGMRGRGAEWPNSCCKREMADFACAADGAVAGKSVELHQKLLCWAVG